MRRLALLLTACLLLLTASAASGQAVQLAGDGEDAGGPAAPTCPDDRDCDGVANAQDACEYAHPRGPGDPARPGCPGDGDGDGVRDDMDYDDPNTDPDSDGVLNSGDNCPGSFRGNPPATTGTPGCLAFHWFGRASNGTPNLGTVVDQGFIQLYSACNPGICKTVVTLTAGKKAQRQLGLKKALIGRKTIVQKWKEYKRGGGYRTAEGSFAEFDLPRKVVRKMDDLDKVELEVKFVVTGDDQPEMEAVKFTKSGTLKMDRRRATNDRTGPRGQGLELFRGTCPSETVDCKEVNAN